MCTQTTNTSPSTGNPITTFYYHFILKKMIYHILKFFGFSGLKVFVHTEGWELFCKVLYLSFRVFYIERYLIIAYLTF